MKSKVLAIFLPYFAVMGWIVLLTIFHPPVETVTVRSIQQGAERAEAGLASQMKTDIPLRLQAADQCLPWLKEQRSGFTHYELICSAAAWQAESQAFAITDTFSVSEAMSRRVRFWQRIYSLFSPHDFVIHLAEHPEVILEIIHDPKISIKLGASQKLRKHLQERREYYADLFKTMDQTAATKWSAEMVRISGLMSHISNKKKYAAAAKDIRSQRGQRDYIKQGIEAASRYLPLIEQEFIKRSLPPELARIAFVESSFNLRAVSKVGASGVYQLMPFVARTMMKVGSEIDERRDPIKAGIGAAKVFADNYRMLNHWPLAVTGYNHGPFGVRKAVQQTKTHELSEIIDRYQGKAFGFASKNFYASFLAMLWTLKRADQHFPDLELQAPIQFKNYTLKSPTRIRTIAQNFNTNTETLAVYNPDILPTHVKSNGLLPKGYQIKIPENQALVENWQQQAWQTVVMYQKD